VIVIDASALLSVLLDEDDSDLIQQVIARAHQPLISASSVMECTLRFGRLGMIARDGEIDVLIGHLDAQIVPIELEQLSEARAAFARFGKGTGHAAQLNFGDCFSYALAKTRNLPLLYKGDDFARTDIASALP
jgi:ribonuclease VapC